MVKGYCLKEKKHVEISKPVYELNKLGRPVVRGVCASCGTKVYKILPANEVPDNLRSKKKGGAKRSSKRSSKSKAAGKGASSKRRSRRRSRK